MKNKIFLFLILLTGISKFTYSQDSDFGLWYQAGIQKSLDKKLDLELSGTIHTFDNGSKIDQAYIEAGLSYDLNKYVGFAGSYRIGNYLDDNYLYHIRHKWLTDVTGSFPLNRFTFSARLRLQITERTYFEDGADKKAEYDGRVRLKVIYRTPGFPINPYISYESFSHIRADADPLIYKSRSILGLEYKLNRKNKINAEYLYQRDNTPQLSVIHILSMTYTFKF